MKSCIQTRFSGRGPQKGFEFTVIKRSPDSCILYKESNGSGEYEVARIKTAKKDSFIKGRLVRAEGDEYLPSDSRWGLEGWSVASREKAEEKFKQINGWSAE